LPLCAHGGGQLALGSQCPAACQAAQGCGRFPHGSVRSPRHGRGSHCCHCWRRLRGVDAHSPAQKVPYLQYVRPALRGHLQGLVPALPPVRRLGPARPGRDEGLLGRNQAHRGLPEEVTCGAASPPAPAPLLPRARPVLRHPLVIQLAQGVTRTLPTTPASAAWWAAAVSASANLCTGRPVRSPAASAAVMSAAARSSAVAATP
jgi:hypothetical protein